MDIHNNVPSLAVNYKAKMIIFITHTLCHIELWIWLAYNQERHHTDKMMKTYYATGEICQIKAMWSNFSMKVVDR